MYVEPRYVSVLQLASEVAGHVHPLHHRVFGLLGFRYCNLIFSNWSRFVTSRSIFISRLLLNGLPWQDSFVISVLFASRFDCIISSIHILLSITTLIAFGTFGPNVSLLKSRSSRSLRILPLSLVFLSRHLLRRRDLLLVILRFFVRLRTTSTHC